MRRRIRVGDLYADIHDQTLRMLNEGLIADEIGDQMPLPPTLDKAWRRPLSRDGGGAKLLMGGQLSSADGHEGASVRAGTRGG